MVRRHLHDRLVTHMTELLELVERRHIVLFFQHFHEFQENSGSCLRIIDRAMMIFQRDAERLRHRVKLKPIQVREERSRKRHRIEDRRIKRQSKKSRIVGDKAHVEGRIVCH